jgi:hypothetical protein
MHQDEALDEALKNTSPPLTRFLSRNLNVGSGDSSLLLVHFVRTGRHTSHDELAVIEGHTLNCHRLSPQWCVASDPRIE